MSQPIPTPQSPPLPTPAGGHSGVLVRGMRPADRAPLARVLGRLCEQGSFTPEEARVALELIDVGLLPGQPDYRFLVAEVADAPDTQGIVAGYACFGDAPMTDRVVDLYWIGIDPALQGRSIGRALLSEVERAVQASGGRMLIAETAGKPSYAATPGLLRANGVHGGRAGSRLLPRWRRQGCLRETIRTLIRCLPSAGARVDFAGAAHQLGPGSLASIQDRRRALCRKTARVGHARGCARPVRSLRVILFPWSWSTPRRWACAPPTTRQRICGPRLQVPVRTVSPASSWQRQMPSVWPQSCEHALREWPFLGIGSWGRLGTAPPPSRSGARRLQVRGRPAWLLALHDVTARVCAEQALRRAEQRLESIFRASPPPSGSARSTAGLLDVNDRCCQLFGYLHDEMVGRTSLDLGLWVDRSERTELLQQAVERGRATGEVRLRHRSGQTREAIVSIARLEGTDPLMLAVMFVDITERKQAEQRVRLNEQRFRALAEHSADTILLVQADGFALWAGESCSGLLGIAAKDLVGRNAFEFLHPDDEPHARARFAEALATPGCPVRAQYRLRHSDGSWRLVEGTAVNHLSDPAIAAMVVTQHDVTERQQAQDQLERFFTLSLELLVIAEVGDRIRRVNGAWQTILGYAPEALVGKAFSELVHPDDVAAAVEATARAERGEPVLHLENRVRARDGTYRSIVWNAVPAIDEGLIYATGRDVTEHRSLELQLAQIQRLESIGRLAGGVAHDFNNMLTAISGYAELVSRELPPDHRCHADLREVLRAAERARILTRQLLAFGRKQVLQPQVLDVNEVVTDMEAMLRHLLGEDVQITVARESTGTVLADRLQLEQVLVNLAVNARDAMRSGGRLRIATSDVELDDTPVGEGIPSTPGWHVLLSVEDTGTGHGPRDPGARL